MAKVRSEVLWCCLVWLAAACAGEGDGPATSERGPTADVSLDGTPLAAERVRASSFAPNAGTTENGAPANQLWWRYRINQGMPMVVDADDGTRTSTTFEDLVIVITRDPTVRTSLYWADLEEDSPEGRASSSLRQRTDIQYGGRPAAIVEQRRTETLALRDAFGSTTTIESRLKAVPDAPVREALDAVALDRFPVGHVETSSTAYTFSGERTSQSSNGRVNSEPVDSRASSLERWEVIEQLDELTVQGRTYRTVVKLRHETGNGEGEGEVTLLWVAKGVGLIRADGKGPSSRLELAATNLWP